MAFPETGILDDFNRSDEGPPPSASWTNMINGGLEVVNNVVEGNAPTAHNFSYWNVETFGPDSECYARIAPDAYGDHSGVMVRIDTGGVDGYFSNVDVGANELKMRRIDDNVFTQLGATIELTVSEGDRFGIEMIGSTYNAYLDDGGGWDLAGTRTDGTYTSAGYIALWAYGNQSRQDDFGGGTILIGGQPAILRTQGVPTGAGARNRPGGWN